MIELKINADTAQDLLAQLNALAAAMGGSAVVCAGVGGIGGIGGVNGGCGGPATSTAPVVEDPKPVKTRTTKKDEAKAPEPAPVETQDDSGVIEELPAEDDTSTETQGGVEVPALSYDDDVKPAILRLSMSKGREAVFRVLNSFGAEKSAQEIDPSKWAAVIQAVEDELEAK